MEVRKRSGRIRDSMLRGHFCNVNASRGKSCKSGVMRHFSQALRGSGLLPEVSAVAAAVPAPFTRLCDATHLVGSLLAMGRVTMKGGSEEIQDRYCANTA